MGALAFSGALALLGMAPARAADGVNDWATLRARLAACWTAPAGTEGSLIAYRFGLDKTGALRGKPLVTARALTGDAEARRSFEDSATKALEACLPVPVTPSFGAILGESPLRLRFVNTKPAAAYQINSNMTIFGQKP